MDSEVVTEIHETEVSNSNENVPSMRDNASENELGTELKTENQDSANNDQTSIKSDKIIEDNKETEVHEQKEQISTQMDNEKKHIETEITTSTDVTKSENVESHEDKINATVIPMEVKESSERLPEIEKAEQEKNTTETLVMADTANSPLISKDEAIEPKITTTEKTQKESGETKEDDDEEDDYDEEEEDINNTSEDEVIVLEAHKTEKVEDAKVLEQQHPEPANIVKNEEFINPEPAKIVKNDGFIKEVNNISTNIISNQIENIISDIDINIKAQEKIAQLKEQELQLIEKQKQLATQIHQQQLLAEKLITQNQIKENELKRAQEIQQQQLHYQLANQYTEKSVPKSEPCTNNYKQIQDDIYKTKESSNLSRTVDLRKIFTPATDAPQIVPKNRKLYASSAFYSPTLHPTVEDQVELARRISHSLSDISNQKSKGQSMFVNRKKRSVKWVHEGSFQGEDDTQIENQSLLNENAEVTVRHELTQLDKLPLKLIMNPRGQMRDYNSLKDSINIEAGLLSPENCAELITALQLHKGRGAELFAKRRRKADNWVVDETNAGTHSPSGIPDYQQYQAKPASPSILPAYSDAGKHRVQLNLHQDQLIEKYSKPGVTVVKSPWEAALQTGSASSAFLQDPTYSIRQTPISSVGHPEHFNHDVNDNTDSIQSYSRAPASYDNIVQESNKNKITDTRFHAQSILPSNPQRELAYKPSVAQGWGGRSVELPRGLYVPKEISLKSYAPPPAQTLNLESSVTNYPIEYSDGVAIRETVKGFPMGNAISGLYSTQPPKQHLYGPQSYVKVPSNSMETTSQVNFNPSPLPYEKMSKFEETTDKRSSNKTYLNVSRQHKHNNVRNMTPTPFGTEFDNRYYHPQSSFNKNMGVLNTPPTSHFSQSFNNCARGWSMGPERNSVFGPKAQVASVNKLPYSDF